MAEKSSLLESLDLSDRIWHLRRAILVQGLAYSELKAISELAEDRVMAEGEWVYEQGRPATALYFLNRGCVRLSIVADDAREKTTAILRGGDVFGLESLAAGQHFRTRAVAHEESWISTLAGEQLRTLLEKRPRMQLNLIQILLYRLSEAHDDIHALCFLDMHQRLAQALLKLARRHGQQLATQPNLVRLKLRMSHDYLARLTGANRPYLSNIMSEFRQKGWIRYQRRHLLIDVDALNRTFGQ